LLLEKAPAPERGGNSFFTAGAFRFAHHGLDDLRRDVLPDLSEAEARAIDIDAYPEARFFDDLARLTENLTDPDLADTLVRRSRPTIVWMRAQGLRFIPMFGRQAYRLGDRHRFWGGLAVEAAGGGPDWELARVRGTRHNTGDGIRMALEINAQPYGHWSACHAVAWDLNAPPFGDRRVGDLFQKHSYPLGLIVNNRGERFVDEGADL